MGNKADEVSSTLAVLLERIGRSKPDNLIQDVEL